MKTSAASSRMTTIAIVTGSSTAVMIQSFDVGNTSGATRLAANSVVPAATLTPMPAFAMRAREPNAIGTGKLDANIHPNIGTKVIGCTCAQRPAAGDQAGGSVELIPKSRRSANADPAARNIAPRFRARVSAWPPAMRKTAAEPHTRRSAA